MRMKKSLIYIFCIFCIVPLFLQLSAQQNQNNGDAYEIKSPIPNGYGNLTWGVPLSEAADKIEGRISFTDDKQIIISKDGELEYWYGFFYADPARMPEEPKEPDAADNTVSDEGRLFFVSLKFPYLSMDTVKQKLVDKYGQETLEDIKNNSGAVAWESEQTTIIMWIDEYEKKPFCRKINYISRETIKELNDYVYRIFNKTELEVIEKLNP